MEPSFVKTGMAEEGYQDEDRPMIFTQNILAITTIVVLEKRQRGLAYGCL